MIIVHWCHQCQRLHGTGEVIPAADDAGFHCRLTGALVEVRGIADDPDDPQHGIARCPRCAAPYAEGVRICPACD